MTGVVSGYDRWAPYTLDELDILRSDNYPKFLAGYLNPLNPAFSNVYNGTGWSVSDFANVRQAGFLPLAIWVPNVAKPATAGAEAALDSYEKVSSTMGFLPLVLDLERYMTPGITPIWLEDFTIEIPSEIPLVIYNGAHVSLGSTQRAYNEWAVAWDVLIPQNYLRGVTTMCQYQPNTPMGDVDVMSRGFFDMAMSKIKPKTWPATSTPSTPPTKSTTEEYMVKAGDTLSAIAARFGTTWQVLGTLNHLSNPNLIYPDQMLTVPSNTTRTPSAIVYTVKPGDTLSEIAATYRTTWQSLAVLNHLSNPNLIFPGQKLVVS